MLIHYSVLCTLFSFNRYAPISLALFSPFTRFCFLFTFLSFHLYSWGWMVGYFLFFFVKNDSINVNREWRETFFAALRKCKRERERESFICVCCIGAMDKTKMITLYERCSLFIHDIEWMWHTHQTLHIRIKLKRKKKRLLSQKSAK